MDNAKKFASGGIVDYTGPAWVDGSPSNPEAFLSVDDTRLIGNLVNLLTNIPSLNPNTVPAGTDSCNQGAFDCGKIKTAGDAFVPRS